MVLRHIRLEEVPAEAIKRSNRTGREANRPTGTEINLTTETAQQAAGDASDAKTAADQAAEDALAAAIEAGAVRTLAEGLYQVIPSETEPTSSPAGELKAGDQWWVVGAGPLAGKFIGVKVYDGAAWVDRQIVASSVLVPGSVGNVLIADGAVDGKVITGALIRTAEGGMRLELTPDGLEAFNAADAKVATLFASSGGLAIDGTMQARAGDATYERTAELRGEQMIVGTFRVGEDYVSTVGMTPGIGTPGFSARIHPDVATGPHFKDAGMSADSSGAHVRLRRYLPDDSDYSSLVMQLLNDKSARIWSTDGALLVLAQEGPITLRSETHGIMLDGPVTLTDDRPLPGTMLALDSKLGSTTGASAGTTLSTITGGAALSVPVTVDVATEVVISARANLYGSSGGGCQLGTNQTGDTPYTTPTDDPSVGKAPAGADMVVESKRYATLLPGTTNVVLAWRGAGGNSIRNPTIAVQAL